MPRANFIKDPDAVLDYEIDWTEWLDGDAIQTATWHDPTDGLTVVRSSTTNTVSTVWLSGGTVGATAKVTCRVVTNGGRTEDRTLSLWVTQR